MPKKKAGQRTKNSGTSAAIAFFSGLAFDLRGSAPRHMQVHKKSLQVWVPDRPLQK